MTPKAVAGWKGTPLLHGTHELYETVVSEEAAA
jgi:hypothetical protein